MYTLRNDKGVMIAKMNDECVAALALYVPGQWRPYNSGPTGQIRCFEITEARSFEASWGCLFLWEGYVLIEDTSRFSFLKTHTAYVK